MKKLDGVQIGCHQDVGEFLIYRSMALGKSELDFLVYTIDADLSKS